PVIRVPPYRSSAFPLLLFTFFFSNAPAPTELYTLSLHDALPISPSASETGAAEAAASSAPRRGSASSSSRKASAAPGAPAIKNRSEEHTSELQSRGHLVCRLLLEKKKVTKISDATRATNLQHIGE